MEAALVYHGYVANETRNLRVVLNLYSVNEENKR